MKNRRNYYRILHVQPDAPPAIVRASYRTLMQKLKAHPDLGGDEFNARLLNEAYAVISDPDTRAAYDETFGPQTMRKDAGRPAGSVPDPAQRSTQPTETRESPRQRPPPRVAVNRCAFCGDVQPDFRLKGVALACACCGSPQRSVLELNPGGARERVLWRTSRETPVSLFTHWPQARPHPGWITDISPGGVGIRSPVQLALDAIVRIDSAELQAIVHIVDSRSLPTSGNTGFRMGGRFITLELPVRQGNFVSVKT